MLDGPALLQQELPAPLHTMTVSDQFSTFCGNLTVVNRETISLRYKSITKRLNLDFWGWESESLHSLYSGSYGRGTAIRGWSDLDMIFWLHPDDYARYNAYVGNGQSALLQYTRNSISKTYPNTDVSGDGQVVVVKFADGTHFDVVPSFEQPDGSFLFPDSNEGGKWKKCDPRPEITALQKVDNATNGNLKWLCRMARAWKQQMDVSIKGLLIDTLAHNFIQTWQYRDKSFVYYDWMSRDFFRFLADQKAEQWYWYAPGSNQLVFNEDNFRWKATRAYNISLEAISYASKEQWWSSCAKWREIYGTAFPNP
jgi:hypothetical protein